MILDRFSQAPLLVLVPERGNLSRLKTLQSSLANRYDRVSMLREGSSATEGRDVVRRLEREEEMLKVVLDWIELQSGGARRG